MKIFKRAFILLLLPAFMILKADDLLFKLSGGELNEDMVGVKKLSEKEMREVRGGYEVRFKIDYASTQMYAIGFYTNKELEKINRGLCGVDLDGCANPSYRRLVDWMQVVDYSWDFFPVYKVERQIRRTRFGQSYPLFRYAAGAMDRSGQLYIFDSTRSSMLLNYNSVIREISAKYKSAMESTLNLLPKR